MGANKNVARENQRGATVEIKGEKEKGSVEFNVDGAAGNVSGGGEGDVSVGANIGGEGGASGGGEGGASAGEGGEGSANVGAIPQMSRSRLREILYHAEGKCIKC